MRKQKRPISKSDKAVYRISFGVLLALLIIVALNYIGIFKLLHKAQAWYYVDPSTFAIISFAVMILAAFLLLISCFEKTCLNGVPLKELTAVLKTKKWIIGFVCLLCFAVLFVLSNLLCFTGASEKGFFKNGKPVSSYEQITQVDVEIEDAQIISGLHAILHKPVIVCSVQTGDQDYVIDSDFFFGFEKLDAFLQRIPKEKKQIHEDRLSELKAYLQNRGTSEMEQAAVDRIFRF